MVLIVMIIVIYILVKTFGKENKQKKKITNKHCCGVIITGYKNGYVLYNFDRRSNLLHFVPLHSDLKGNFEVFEFEKIKAYVSTPEPDEDGIIKVTTKYNDEPMHIEFSISGLEKFDKCWDSAKKLR